MQTTVFRPSIIYGRDDHFLNLFAKLARIAPVLPVGCSECALPTDLRRRRRTRDHHSLGDSHTFGQTYNVCGPRAYTLQQLVEFVCSTLGLRRRVIGLNPTLSMLQAQVLEHLPGKLMTRDNVLSMRVDNTCDGGFPAVFGFTPTPLEAEVPTYLGGRHTALSLLWVPLARAPVTRQDP